MLPFAAVLAIAALGQTLSSSRAASTSRSPARSRWPSSSSPTIPTGDDGSCSARSSCPGVWPWRPASTASWSAACGSTRSSPRSAPTRCSSAPCSASPAAPPSYHGPARLDRRRWDLGHSQRRLLRGGGPRGHRVVVKLTPAGRRFEAVGANPAAAWAAGLRVTRHRPGYLWAQLLYWLAGVLLAGIVAQPTAFQGNTYLLPTVAAVVLGGTSLLGGRGNLVATAVAALFLSQLDQFVLALGVSFAVRTLVQAAALAIGVALYTVDWARSRAALRFRGGPLRALGDRHSRAPTSTSVASRRKRREVLT